MYIMFIVNILFVFRPDDKKNLSYKMLPRVSQFVLVPLSKLI